MEKKEFSNWQTVGIGMRTGIILSLILGFFIYALILVGLIDSNSVDFVTIPLLVFIGVGWSAIPGGIVGAVIGKIWKKSPKAVRDGALIGAVFAMIILGLLNGSWINLFTSGLYIY